MKYLEYDEASGNILAWYDKGITPVVPVGCIAVCNTLWQEAINMSANHYDTRTKTFSRKDLRTDKQAKEDFIKAEKSWVKSELALADINVNYHVDEDDRKVSTKEHWQVYRRSLRDYIIENEVVNLNGKSYYLGGDAYIVEVYSSGRPKLIL